MLLLTTLSLVYAITLTLLLAPSPIVLGGLILILALLLSALFGLISSSWFALLLFLIYVGGLLVMFSYFIALCPNLPIPMNAPSITLLLTFTSFFTTFLLFPPTLNFFPLIPTMVSSVTSMLLTDNLPLLIFLASTLFFALILIVKITRYSSGPLRPFTPSLCPIP